MGDKIDTRAIGLDTELIERGLVDFLVRLAQLDETGDELAIKLLPMTSQADYDRLLWSCDLNLVRGEDSFVRAQWAARPFLWHIYPQDDQAHIAKLDDFLDHYLEALPADGGQWLRAFNHALNHGQDVHELWAQWPQFGTIWQQHARSWSQKLLADGDLVTRLVKFLESRI